MSEPSNARYRRYRRAVSKERLPCAIVDLDAVDANTEALLAEVRPSGKTLRLATKSIRCPALIEYVIEREPELLRGLMGYAVSEAAFWVERGQRDVLVAYPSVQLPDIELLCQLNEQATVSIIADSADGVEQLSRRAAEIGGTIPLVIEVDMSLRALGGRLHLGVHRSPVHTAEQVVELARLIRDRPGVRFHGVMGYEAQVAGLGDASPFSRALNPVKSMIRKASVPVVGRRRQEVAEALEREGFELALFNGGGTGSLRTTPKERAVTEVTAGSGFLCSHLFDYYRHLSLEPAAYFALQVVRKPGDGYVTCHGGGLVASGEAGRDRLPIPALPDHLRLTQLEGAGEVQTPLTGPGTSALALGDPVFFRHAKAGELAEHFNEYLLVRGDRIVDRAKTYRGFGQRFL